MLCWTGDPVRQTTRKACCSLTTSCCRQSSRTSTWKPTYQKVQNAASTPVQAATAHAGSHGGRASAAAAAAPTVVQELLVQVADEAHCQRYAQRHLDVEQMQLQHPDQVLLQQQLEHLHQQQHLQQQQQQQHRLRPLQQHDKPHHSWGQDWQQHAAWWHQQQQQQPLQVSQPVQQSTRSSHSARPGFSPANARRPAEQASGNLQLQHNMPRQHEVVQGPQVVAAAHAAGAFDGALQPASHSASSDRSWSKTNTPAARAETAMPPFFAAVRPHEPHEERHNLQQQHFGEASSSSTLPSESGQLLVSRPVTQRHQPQQVGLQQMQQQLGRTAAGVAMVRLHKGSKPSQVAALLHSCLLQEQQVVLSAAGAQLALVALQCLEKIVTLQQQQLPGSLLLAVAHHRSSKRPGGLGRCQVYDIMCSLQHGVLEQPQQQLPEQQQQQQQEQVTHTGVYQAPQAVLPEPQAVPQHALAQVQREQQQLLQQQQRQRQHQCHPGGAAAPQQPTAHSAWQLHTAGSGQQALSAVAVPTGDGWAAGPQHLAPPLPQPPQQQQQAVPAQLHIQGQHRQRLVSSQEHPAQGHLQQELACCGHGNGWHSQLYPAGQQHQEQSLLHELPAGNACMQQEPGSVRTPAMQPAADVKEQQMCQARQQADGQQQQQQPSLYEARPQPHQQWQQLSPHAAVSGGGGGGAEGAATRPLVAAPAMSAAGDPRSSAGRIGVDPAAGDAPAMPVQLLKVAGCSIDLADALDDALLGGSHVVALPVAHPKQAVRALEAASLVGRRWRQRHQQQQQVAERRGSSSAGSTVAAMQPELQLVVQPRRGKVPRECGSIAGLHVFVYAAPFVH